MSEFAYYRFLRNNIVTTEEMQQKDEAIRLSEERLDVKDIQCDSRISKLSLEQLIEILDVRRKYKKYKQMIIKQSHHLIKKLLRKRSSTFDRCVHIYNG
jgi:hypothetical protein